MLDLAARTGLRLQYARQRRLNVRNVNVPARQKHHTRVSTGTQTIAGSICGWTVRFPPSPRRAVELSMLASTLNSNLGPFEIGAGELRVNGLLPSTTVQVDSSGVFSGTGSATGTVTLLSGAQMSPGDASVAAPVTSAHS